MALDFYLKKFKHIYPSGPIISEVFRSYQSALEGVPEFLIDVACEEALKQCKFFPTPAELVSFVPRQDNFMGTASFDMTADFIPVTHWFERHLKTCDLLVTMDKYGRKKVKQVTLSANREYMVWPSHWDKGSVDLMTWDEARKKIAVIIKAKSL